MDKSNYDYPDRLAPGSMSSSTIWVPRIDTAENEISLCRSSILSCQILMSSESTHPSQSTRSATWTFDSTHGATHSGLDLDEGLSTHHSNSTHIRGKKMFLQSYSGWKKSELYLPSSLRRCLKFNQLDCEDGVPLMDTIIRYNRHWQLK